MNHNLYAAIERRIAQHALHCAIETPGGLRWSYADLHAHSGRYAAALMQHGARRGDRIAVQVEKSPQAIALYLACLRAGLVFVPLNPAYRRDELTYYLGDAEPSAVVCTGAGVPLLRELSPATAVLSLEADGSGSLAATSQQQSADFTTAVAHQDDLAAILYTSGTTGRSKGAMLTHGNLLSNARTLVELWGFSSGDRLLHALPIFHVHGLFVATHCALIAGAQMNFLAKFDLGQVLAHLPRSSVMMGVPTYYTRLLSEPSFDRKLLRGMRLFVCGSAPLSAETFRAFDERTGHSILERYGMTECGMITSNPLHGERIPGSCGQALPGVEVRVVGAGDVTVPTGEVGNIQVRGPNVLPGYWRMPDKTREEFTADGFFRTGDMGRLDSAGYLTIVGRAKDLIISGGLNVYPKEVEAALEALPGVAEAAVIGLPDADFG